MNPDWNLSSYDFVLPEAQIAQEPPATRGASRLMILDRASGETIIDDFASLPKYLPPSLLIANDSKVIPARLSGRRKTGGKAEFLLLTPPPLFDPRQEPGGWKSQEVEGLIRPAKNIAPGDQVTMGERLRVTVLDKGEFGRCRAVLHWQGQREDIPDLLRVHGSLPLPPYIRRPADEDDQRRYQTVYADGDKAGSVAAPTAGLHFTEDFRAELLANGHPWQNVTLYVGYGTFSPVRCQDIREHPMHSECIQLSRETATAIRAAKSEGRSVLAVGTTAARVLEGAFAASGDIQEYTGETDIFLYPGRSFHVVDALLTNFHLPGSSLLMLVSALAGRKNILAAYDRAVREGFRFFSYGDAMLIR